MRFRPDKANDDTNGNIAIRVTAIAQCLPMSDSDLDAEFSSLTAEFNEM